MYFEFTYQMCNSKFSPRKFFFFLLNYDSNRNKYFKIDFYVDIF